MSDKHSSSGSEVFQHSTEVTDDVARVQTLIVNSYLVGEPGEGSSWVLVDTGMPFTGAKIRSAAEERFGETPPEAIILTHGHFDHVGTVRELAEYWDVPVYAHELELPYLTGRSSYPPGDPTVGGGMMAMMACLYPRGPIDLGRRVSALPSSGRVPRMSGWEWIHTPGHTPGHVSLYRDADRTLIAGDAFVTTQQESALAVLTQYRKVHGPPAYFTPDWTSAGESVKKLAELEPAVAATGHGLPMYGRRLRRGLRALARNFERLAVPSHGRYVRQPAIASERGVEYVPPAVTPDAGTLVTLAAAGVGAALLIGGLLRKRA